MKVRAVIVSGYGLNCEEETKFAFELAGAAADIIHVNDLIAEKTLLSKYQILAMPGGFSYGDDTGSGNAFANRFKNHLWSPLKKFVEKDKLTIGICNGFQILVSLGLLPASTGEYGRQTVALTNNESARYTVRWVDVRIENNSPWLKDITTLMLPIAHGEGKLYADKKVLGLLKKNKQIAFKYFKGEICRQENLPPNPTGTMEEIAGLTDLSGRILGIMPHPERAVHFTQLPHWTYLKEKCLRAGKKIPVTGPGLKIFQNAVNYFNA